MAEGAADRLEHWRIGQVGLALAVPLGSAGLAYAAWALSERLQFWGPFDRATFSWAVIIPLWIGGAAATGWIWSFREFAARARLAIVVWLTEAVVVASTFWFVFVTGSQACETSPRSSPGEMLVPSLVFGLVTGAIPAVAAFAAAGEFAAARPGWAVTLVIGTFAIGVVLFALAFTVIAFSFGGCNRP